MTIRLSLGEVFFLQWAIWLAIWLLSDYVATLLTICVGAVVFAVLIVALLSEMVERSKVPRRYFYIMGLSLLAIMLAAAVYVLILGGRMEFLDIK